MQQRNDVLSSSLFLLWLLLMMHLLSCGELARSEHLELGTGANNPSSGLRQELTASCLAQLRVCVFPAAEV